MKIMLQLAGLLALLYLIVAGLAWLSGRHITKGQ